MSEISPENSQTPVKPSRFSWKRFLIELLEAAAIALVLFIVINIVSVRVRVDGYSMRPTLENNQRVFVNRLSYHFGEPQRGDIVVFGFPSDPDEDYIKRIIGLPGEKVTIQDRVVYIDDTALDEPYIAEPPKYNGEWLVEEGFIFVLGDNRNDSSDSHSWGLLPLDNVIGKALLVYWPIGDASILKHETVSASTP